MGLNSYGSGCGSGYGYGYGYGSGYGYGYGDGDGSGYGYGSGDGYGDGYGYGDGSGYGSGYGYGSGSGSGYGYGDGYGYGYGSGSGSGYGYGYGYGDGDGYARNEYLTTLLEPYELTGFVVAFWKSDSEGSPANGGKGGSRKVGQIEQIAGPLEICTRKALHGTHDPCKWKGDRWWIVRLKEPVQIDGDKMASLEREIVADLGPCPFHNH